MRRLLFAIISLISLAAQAAPERWAVYYTDKEPPEAFYGFDLVVFDSDHHPPIAPLKARGATVLGYLSLGEAETYRSYFNALKEKNLLMAENPQWKGHLVIDVRKPAWQEFIITELVPSIMQQGFDGIMLDTIDSVIQPEIDHPKQYPGMQAAAAGLVKAIRFNYPNIKIMLNRGFVLLPQLAGDIDYVMAENIATDWQPGAKKPHWLTDAERGEYDRLLKDALTLAPKLKIYTIDYWPLKDTKNVKRIYDAQRAAGYIPYVSTMDLQSVHREPK